MSDIDEQIEKLNDEEIWNLYGRVITTLKLRRLIRTRNIVGERGEFLAINIYNATAGLPKLQAAPEGTQNVDALSRKGERYSIKTITFPGKTTGVFYGIGDAKEKENNDKKFEYVIIVVIESEFKLCQIFELNWDQFMKLKHWHSTMRAWNLSLTKDLIQSSKVIYSKKVNA